MNVFLISAIAVAGVIALLFLKDEGTPLTVLVRIGVVVILVSGILPPVKELLSAFESFYFSDNIPKEALKALLKAFCVLAVSSITGDICRDNGENSLGGVVELCGKIMSIALSIPVITAVVSIATSLFQSD